MIYLLAVLLLFSLGCPTSDDDDATGDDDDVTGDDDDDDDSALAADCTSAALPWTDLWCHDWPASGTTLRGQFTAWSAGGVRFEAGDRQLFDFEVRGDDEAFALLPNLQAGGEVDVLQVGYYDDLYGGVHGAVVVHAVDDPTDVLLLTAQHWEGQGPFAGWEVTSDPMDTSACADDPIDDDCCITVFNRPVAFGFGGDTFTLYQGQQQVLGDLAVVVTEALAHGGKQTCPDYYCPRLRYMAFSAP